MMKTTLNDDEKFLIEQGADAVDGELRAYSGRGMYGDVCLGLVVSDVTDLAMVILTVAAEDMDLAETLARSIRYDSMGHSTIIYWPRITWESDDDDDDDDE